jgi:hypothetical protein
VRVCVELFSRNQEALKIRVFKISNNQGSEDSRYQSFRVSRLQGSKE